MSQKNKVNTGGGYNNYSLRSTTLIEGYFPGPQRTNILLDPDLAMGKIDRGKNIMKNQVYNGPGTLMQAIPDASKFQYERVFAQPTGNPYRNFGVDDRQLAGYQVEQLHNNPLSQYTTNPNGKVPGFDCLDEPDNFSNMINKRESEYKNFFETGNLIAQVDWTNGIPQAEGVYRQISGPKINSNAEVVYNMNLNSKEQTNPMISQGSSSRARSQADFTGKCYSGKFVPGEIISDMGGNNPPAVYGKNSTRQRSEMDKGIMNSKVGNSVCDPSRSLNFANPLILD